MRVPFSRSTVQRLKRGLFAGIAGAGAVLPVSAAPSPERPAATAVPGAGSSAIEIIVLEAPGCIYCDLFRSDVKPVYDASPTARAAPLRFLDLNDEAADKLDLTGGPVNIVPTFVVMKDNREVARIPGYLGQENFFRVLHSLLPGLE